MNRPTSWRHDLALGCVFILLAGLGLGSKLFGWTMGRRRT